MSTKSPDLSPRAQSPVGHRHFRKTDKGAYVQRWKVLQDRNRNLPKIDFGVKSQIIPKRQNKPVGIGARSLTLDSLKLPSLCTASSVITTSTNMSGPTARTDVLAGKKSVGIQVLIHFTRWKYGENQIKDKDKELVASISRSLPNIATAVQNESNVKTSSKHRFERISYSKKILNRKGESKEKTEEITTTVLPKQELEQSGS